jgi:flagellar motor switch protein FliG
MTAAILEGGNRNVQGSLRVEDVESGFRDDPAPLLDTSAEGWSSVGAISPLRKAAIVLVTLDRSLASQLLSYLNRSAVEAVTWEITRLEPVAPAERRAVLEEFCAVALRRLCVDFDELVAMTDADIRKVFREVDVRTWALALVGAAEAVRSKVLGAVSISMAMRLRRDLDRVGPFRLSDSEAAQREITERLRRLRDQGRSSLSESPGKEDEG